VQTAGKLVEAAQVASLQLLPELAGQPPSIDRTALRDANGHVI